MGNISEIKKEINKLEKLIEKKDYSEKGMEHIFEGLDNIINKINVTLINDIKF